MKCGCPAVACRFLGNRCWSLGTCASCITEWKVACTVEFLTPVQKAWSHLKYELQCITFHNLPHTQLIGLSLRCTMYRTLRMGGFITVPLTTGSRG